MDNSTKFPITRFTINTFAMGTVEYVNSGNGVVTVVGDQREHQKVIRTLKEGCRMQNSHPEPLGDEMT